MSFRRRALALVISALGIALLAASSDAAAQSKTTPKWKSKNTFGVHCGSWEDCKAFCAEACDVDATTGRISCPRVPTEGAGLLPADSPLLEPIPKMKYVKSDSSRNRATARVIEGLQKLDAWLEKSPERAKFGTTVLVRSCWRDGTYDSKKECYFIMKGKDPKGLGLSWPGANAHSAGNACDIVLVDAKGREATACSADAESELGAGIDFRTASRLLDEALTNDTVGAKRLNYEAWHYEWGGPSKCRCKAPACANDYWPPRCGHAEDDCAKQTP
jgi:hypothetical protein